MLIIAQKERKKKMENFEQLVRKVMKERGIDDRLTNIILSNKLPEEITKAIEKTVIEIAEEKKKAEEKKNKLEREVEIKATITEKGTSLEIESEANAGTYMLGGELLITVISLVGYLIENLGDEESKGVLKEILEAAIENPNLMCRLVSAAMLATKNARDSLKEHTKKEED